MLQSEYEALTGNPIEAEEYQKIERVYMAASDAISKEDFCKAMKKANSDTTCLIYDLTKQAERFQRMAREAKQEAKRECECGYELKKENAGLCRINTELRKDFNEAIAQKVNLALALMGAGMEHRAIEILGHGYVISLKCSTNMELTNKDKAYIAKMLANK